MKTNILIYNFSAWHNLTLLSGLFVIVLYNKQLLSVTNRRKGHNKSELFLKKT